MPENMQHLLGPPEDEAKEKLMKCFAVEMASSEIYGEFMQMFPEDSEFWGGLSREEQDHANFLVSGDVFEFIGEGEGSMPLPPSIFIDKTLVFIDGVKARIRNETLTLEKALQIALTLETSIVESYIFEMETAKAGSYLERFRRLLVDSRSHVDKVKDYMIKKGYAWLC